MLEDLKYAAQNGAILRGHVLGEWIQHSRKHRIHISNCVYCNMQVAINTNPLPNEIDIGGEAIALNCKG